MTPRVRCSAAQTFSDLSSKYDAACAVLRLADKV
jgi:hypothetical protein